MYTPLYHTHAHARACIKMFLSHVFYMYTPFDRYIYTCMRENVFFVCTRPLTDTYTPFDRYIHTHACMKKFLSHVSARTCAGNNLTDTLAQREGGRERERERERETLHPKP